jgi:hypothetical protein
MCGTVPIPALDTATRSGFFLASARNSSTVFQGASARTVTDEGSSVKRAMGWKSPTVVLPMPIRGTTSISGVISTSR